MHEQGRVVAVGEGIVDVRMDISPACDGCGLCASGRNGETIMRGVRDALGATVGDTVDITIPDSVTRRAIVAVFVVPVVALFAGYLAGFLLGSWLHVSPDLAGFLLAIMAASIAFVGVRTAEKRIARSDRFSPEVSAIIARTHDRP